MDLLFQRSIICTYLAWREAKQRGSWFLLAMVTPLFVLMLSIHGCAMDLHPYYAQARRAQEAVPPDYIQTAAGIRERCLYGVRATAERERALRMGYPYTFQDCGQGTGPVPPPVTQGVILDGTRTVGADWFPTAPRPVRAVGPQPYDACSIYGMDQSKWLALTAKDREHVRFRNFHHGYNDRHLPQARGTHSAPRATSPIITPHATQAEQTDVQRGMNWEDQYDYGGDGQNDGGGTGGFLP